MDDKKLEEVLILIKNNHNLLLEMNKNMNEKFEAIDRKFEAIDKKFNSIDKKFEAMDKKRIDDNFYFEHTYGEKISIIFDKLQLIDQLDELDKKENLKLQDKIEQNSAKLMSHDFRISKLEKIVNS